MGQNYTPCNGVGYESSAYPHHPHPHPHRQCEPPPGGITLLKINIPAGAVIRLLNLIEISSPAGICLIIRIPLSSGTTANTANTAALAGIMNMVRQAGGSVQVMNE